MKKFAYALVAMTVMTGWGCPKFVYVPVPVGPRATSTPEPTSSPSSSPSPVPVLTASPTAEPTSTIAPLPSPVWEVSVQTVNGFAHCNPDAAGNIASGCAGDVTILVKTPGFDLVPKGSGCELICPNDFKVLNHLKTFDECMQDCYQHDDPYGTCCGGACACDQDHWTCKRVEVACGGKVSNDFKPKITAVGPNVRLEVSEGGFGFQVFGSGPVTICADVPTRPFVTSFSGKKIRTSEAVPNCKSGNLI